MADVGWTELVVTGVTVLGFAAGVVKALMKSHTDRVDEHGKTIEGHGKEIADLKRTAVTQDGLERAMERSERTIVGAVDRMRNDLATQIGAVKQTADASHTRIDELQRDEINRLKQGRQQ